MKAEELFRAIGAVNDDIIEETAPGGRRETALPGQKRLYVRFSLAFGCACAAFLIFFGIRFYQTELLPETNGLKELQISFETEGMGFEGLMAYDISELVNVNPWSAGEELAELPVYENTAKLTEDYRVIGDEEKMREQLLEAADRLGLDADKLTVTTDVPDKETQKEITEKYEIAGDKLPEDYFLLNEAAVSGNGLHIRVDAERNTFISFDPPVKLPEEYQFSFDSGYNELFETAKYFRKEYAMVLNMEMPEVNIWNGDYSYDGVQQFHLSFFDAGGDYTEKIINYNFRQIHFQCNDAGDLDTIYLQGRDLSNKVGDYPIITLEKAEKLLSEGKYVTSVPEKMPGMEYVAKAELVYRATSTDQYFMPYYRFFAELPDQEQDNGLKMFGAFYVPAVEEKYISNMPLWDGSFN